MKKKNMLLKLFFKIVQKTRILLQPYIFTEQHAEVQNIIDATPGETVVITTELPEPGMEVTWLKENTPLSLSDGRYQTLNKDCSYQLVIANATSGDSGIYKLQGGEYESLAQVNISG